jgi:dihydrofolate reductase
VPVGVQFVTESIRAFAERLRKKAGRNLWMMGRGEIIGFFLDEDAIGEFIITVVPTGTEFPHCTVRCRSGCYLSSNFRIALFNFITKGSD